MDLDRWLVPLNRAPAGTPSVICFPPAGSGPMWFRPLAQAVGVAVHGVQLPGRGPRLREPLPASLEALAERLHPAVAQALGSSGVLIGHSMGALLLFEVARRLVGTTPAGALHLIVSGRAAPDLSPAIVDRHRLPDEELVRSLIELGSAPEPFAEPELRALLLSALRGDLRLCETYRFREGPPLPFRVTALAGTDDAEAAPPAVAAWSRQAGGPFDLEVWPGNHFFLERHFPRLADLVLAPG